MAASASLRELQTESTPLASGPPPSHIDLSELGGLLGVRRFHVTIVAVGFLLNLVPASLVGPVPYILRDVQKEFGVHDAEASLIMSGVVFGSIAGIMITSWSGDYLGRRLTMLLCAAGVALLGALHLVVADFWQLIALRAAIGVPYGGLITIIAPYVIEFAADGARGLTSNASNLAWPTGSVLAIVLVKYGNYGWRVDLSVCSFWAIAAVLFLLAMPESPRWLLVSGDAQEGQRILSQIFASQPIWGRASVGEAPVVRVKSPSSGSLDNQGSPLGLVRELFTAELCPMTTTSSFIAVVTFAISNAGWVWGPSIIAHAAGVDVDSVPLWVFLVTELCGVIGTFIAMALMDTVGRKPLLVGSYACGAVLTLALVFNPTLSQAVAVWLLLGVQSGLMWAVLTTYFCEAFPTRIRGTGVGFCFLAGRLAGGSSPIAFGAMLEKSATIAILSLALLFAIGALGSAGFMRETAHKSLADVELT